MNLRKWIIRSVIGIVAACLILAGLSAFLNRNLSTQSEIADRLSQAEKDRLSEFFQVRQVLGHHTWPGWESVDMPLIIYNESYAFLIGYANPPDGWVKVPQNEPRGSAWEPVPGDLFNGETYYRQPLPASGESPEAFAVKVGNRWAASLATMEWFEISLANQFRDQLPGFLKPIFPYAFVNRFFVRGSEGYISLLAHESFHAFQGQAAPDRLAAAESAVSHSASNYPWTDTEADWQTELDLLAEAVRAETSAEAAELAGRFLAQRDQRRQTANLADRLVDYERHREWLEGLARYVELEIWRQAYQAEGYEPVAALQADPKFSGYRTFDRRWDQEIAQIGRMAADDGDGRFYYSGMAQAVLLDQLLPDWKSLAMGEGIFLEDLLIAALAENQ